MVKLAIAVPGVLKALLNPFFKGQKEISRYLISFEANLEQPYCP
jgi:hypothetical protein